MYRCRQLLASRGNVAWCIGSCQFGKLNFLETSPANKYVIVLQFSVTHQFKCFTKTTTSTPAWTKSWSRCLSASRVPTAAPTSNCLPGSIDANGYSRDFFKSVRAINDTSSPHSLTMGNLPFLDFSNIALASCRVTPEGAVTKSPAFVITCKATITVS